MRLVSNDGTPERTLPPAEYRKVKLATRRLTAAVGGLEAGAAVTRVSHAALSDCANEARPDRFLAADVIADLEAVAGDPIVTRQLAALAGYELRSVEQSKADMDIATLHRLDARVAATDGAFAATELDALTDGRLSPTEIRALIERGEAAMAAERARVDHLHRMLAAGRPTVAVDGGAA